jgi:hypothetical protein
MTTIALRQPVVKRRRPVAKARALVALGYRPGAPHQVTEENQAIDRQACRCLRCGTCDNRGLTYNPFHGPGGSYRVLAVCVRCRHAEEL